MVIGAASQPLADQARRLFTEELVKGLPAVVQDVCEAARAQLDRRRSERDDAAQQREALQAVRGAAAQWHRGIVGGLRNALMYGVSASRVGELPMPKSARDLTLVSDDTIELEIMTSRLALAVMDTAATEFADLRSRIANLERVADIDTNDLLRAHVLARVIVDAWHGAGLTQDPWRALQASLHTECASLVTDAYHETNRWLIERGVQPEVDLRPHIRRNRGVAMPLSGLDTLSPRPSGFGSSDEGAPTTSSGVKVRRIGEDTRVQTRAVPLPASPAHMEAVLGRLNRLVSRYAPGFAATNSATLSPGLAQAIDTAQLGIRQRLTPSNQQGVQITAPTMLDELKQRSRTLKRLAATPEERATIEIVALLFQSILTEDRIPSKIRVWFARLQMPVLRVAVTEPDFFATVDHPARRLIDRMGSCVMGFDAPSSEQNVTDALQQEIKRIVQVVEAYPDTGRRVFQTVLTEFEKFLDHYFKSENEATKQGVSLAQQVEQRETMAVQYTIELRRMLSDVPVQEGVRQFLFHVWADVLATTAVRFGKQGDITRAMKKAAADLIWSASAKVTREERAQVITKLPSLLKALREGMSAAGLTNERQEEQIRQLNDALASAFTAKAAAIPMDRLRDLTERLETIEGMLPEALDIDLDEEIVLDLSGQESAGMEVVSDGGSMPTQAMLGWARELQVGSWYMLDYRGRVEAVQLAWQGARKQLSLFVAASGRCVLFQHHRLAAFLQAGLILPAQDETLTVRATRSALAKLDVDASELHS